MKYALLQAFILITNAIPSYDCRRNPSTLESLHLLNSTPHQTLETKSFLNTIRLSIMSHENRSLFMELPTEIRENIFRYLFVASYTTVEHNMRSKEVSLYISRSYSGADFDC